MKKQATIMGMPVTIDIVDSNAKEEDIAEVFSYFHYIDSVFSTYKKNSEISQINSGKIKISNSSNIMQKILKLSEDTKKITKGFFDIHLNGLIDPSGIVKGYAIYQGAKILEKKGYKNFYVEIAGDIEARGKNKDNKSWQVGIQNPFNLEEIVKVIKVSNKGMATSGTYIRGKHIFNPLEKKQADEIASITVIGPNVYEADRFATAAFAMGEKGVEFLENLKDFEAYMIRKDKTAVFTNGFEKYIN